MWIDVEGKKERSTDDVKFPRSYVTPLPHPLPLSLLIYTHIMASICSHISPLNLPRLSSPSSLNFDGVQWPYNRSQPHHHLSVVSSLTLSTLILYSSPSHHRPQPLCRLQDSQAALRRKMCVSSLLSSHRPRQIHHRSSRLRRQQHHQVPTGKNENPQAFTYLAFTWKILILFFVWTNFSGTSRVSASRCCE